MTEKDYLKDISEIKNIMNRSTRFLSLSGISGILAGVYALIGGAIAYKLLTDYGRLERGETYESSILNLELMLILIAGTVATLSVVTAYVLTKRKAVQNNEKMWAPASRQLLVSFIIPLATGGIFALLLIYRGDYALIAPTMLIFYGLALFNASKFTLSTVKYLGLLEVVLGLVSMLFLGNGLFFWMLGFGVLHIIYGALIYIKLDKKR
ncbi:MAG TPA: hypothetical protein ENK46_08765 [Flavobacteriia bacterium]|jgi:hypothetical protein|nr:hypothetical protein [Flavobacteriia bacterium]